MKILYVEWVDAVANTGWDTAENADPVHRCKTIGFLIKEDKESMVIASTISEKESNARMTIPKAWIKKRRVVKL